MYCFFNLIQHLIYKIQVQFALICLDPRYPLIFNSPAHNPDNHPTLLTQLSGPQSFVCYNSLCLPNLMPLSLTVSQQHELLNATLSLDPRLTNLLSTHQSIQMNLQCIQCIQYDESDVQQACHSLYGVACILTTKEHLSLFTKI